MMRGKGLSNLATSPPLENRTCPFQQKEWNSMDVIARKKTGPFNQLPETKIAPENGWLED